MESYIIRIYRRDAKRLTKVEGIVERAGATRRVTFHSLKELVEHLKGSVSNRGKGKAKTG
jgi:hypothetical protein